MTYQREIFAKARTIRRLGFSINEIASRLKVSKSTISLWTSNEKITPTGKRRILLRQIRARKKAFRTIKMHRDTIRKMIFRRASTIFSKIKLSSDLNKLLCSIFLWTEGGKSATNRVSFTNSDPLMVITFLSLFRRSFELDESKLRALVHIHEYHDEQEILDFWSRMTKIPRHQFTKSYLKPHTRKRIRKDYKGSILIRYYDYQVARELISIYNILAQKLGA